MLVPLIVAVVALCVAIALLVWCSIRRARSRDAKTDLARSQLYQVALHRFLRRFTQAFGPPLATQMSALSFLSREDTLNTVDADRLQELLRTAYEQNVTLHQMIQRIRRFDPFASTVEPVEFQIAPFVEQHVRSRFALLCERGVVDPAAIKLSVTADLPDDARVQTYRGVFGDVLTELLDNALMHGGSGSKIDVRLTMREAKNDTWYATTIRDYGPGLPHESRDRLFDPLSDMTSNASKLALGLHVVSVAVVATLRAHLIYRDANPGAEFTLEICQRMPESGNGWVRY